METWIFAILAIAGGALAVPVAWRLVSEGDIGIVVFLVLAVLAGALGLTAMLSLILKAVLNWTRRSKR